MRSCRLLCALAAVLVSCFAPVVLALFPWDVEITADSTLTGDENTVCAQMTSSYGIALSYDEGVVMRLTNFPSSWASSISPRCRLSYTTCNQNDASAQFESTGSLHSIYNGVHAYGVTLLSSISVNSGEKLFLSCSSLQNPPSGIYSMAVSAGASSPYNSSYASGAVNIAIYSELQNKDALYVGLSFATNKRPTQALYNTAIDVFSKATYKSAIVTSSVGIGGALYYPPGTDVNTASLATWAKSVVAAESNSSITIVQQNEIKLSPRVSELGASTGTLLFLIKIVPSIDFTLDSMYAALTTDTALAYMEGRLPRGHKDITGAAVMKSALLATCFNNVRDSDESDVDCGNNEGDCYACNAGQSCHSDSDCWTALCSNGVCAQPAANSAAGNGPAAMAVFALATIAIVFGAML